MTSATRVGRERGFTMIEVMIALLLTAVAILGIIALYMTSTRASSFSRHATEAAALANDKLETLRTVLTPGGGSDGGPIDEQGKSGGIFTRSWSVSSPGGYHEMQVIVTWEEDGLTRTVTVNGRRNL